MLTRNLLATAVAGIIVSPAWAGVESLSSQEMVDTYIEDSAIIVVPRSEQKTAQQKKDEREQIIRSLTISPGEPIIEESEEQANANIFRRNRRESNKDALQNAEEQFIQRALLFPQDQVNQIRAATVLTPRPSPIIFGDQVQIPDEPFTQNFLNDQLSLGFDGQNVNFSIGNLPGVDPIDVPQSINEGPVQLVPRPGGGFDLSIAVPD